jgi:hypothetical protein
MALDPPMTNPVIDAFRQRMLEKHERFLRPSMELVRLANDLLTRPLTEPLHKVIHAIACVVVNSSGAVMTLVVNGYGNDAMKIVRSMFEGAVTVAYLRLHPELLDNYLDFDAIRRWQMWEHLQPTAQGEAAGVTAEHVAAIKADFDKVAPRFRNRRGDLLGSWCRQSVKQMADQVKLGEFYNPFYGRASGMQHVDITGLQAQSNRETFQIEVAPSENCAVEALALSFNLTFRALWE